MVLKERYVSAAAHRSISQRRVILEALLDVLEGERTVLRSMSDLEGYVIRATDGPIGHVKDFYFDDKSWVVRYLIVDTGSWLSSRKVLISPMSI
jgi:uncharacterized protein YrrD